MVDKRLKNLVRNVKSPRKMIEFCATGMCNILYKLMSKTIANRLESILLLGVSYDHRAFHETN